MIQEVRHFALDTVDPRVGEVFFGELGLDAREATGTIMMHCQGRAEAQVVLRRAPRFGLHRICLGVAPGTLAGMRIRLEQAGFCDPIDRDDGELDSLIVHDPDGRRLELTDRPGSEVTGLLWDYNSPGLITRPGRRGVPSYLAGEVRPRRLVRLGLFSPDPARTGAFYEEALGLIVAASRGGTDTLYLRTAAGGDHHVLQLLRSDGTGLHHAAFEVDSLDDVALTRRVMISSGRRPVWGMGRSTINAELFLYVRDPWNGLVAVVVDADRYPANCTDRTEIPSDGAIHVWSLDGEPPSDFDRRWTFAEPD